MAQKVELRKRSGSTFAGNDNLMLPVTHVNFVLGLLDGNGKFNTSLFNSSMLNTKRMAGTLNADTTFETAYSTIATYNNNETVLYPGSYLVSNGKNIISASTDHIVYYNDDGQNAASTVTLEHGDHLFYIKYGSEYMWVDIATTVNPTQSAGVSTLSAPYNTILGANIFESEEELAGTNPTSAVYGLLTGFKWTATTIGDYNAAGFKVEKSANIGGNVTEADANYLAIPSLALWDYGQGNIVLRIDDIGLGYSYWRMSQVMGTPPQLPKVYQAISYSNKHIWGVINNNYDVATTTSSGLMSSVDKIKLDNLNNYIHPSYTTRSIDTSGVDVLDTFTSDAAGHVTTISTRTLPNATTGAAGVMSAADKTKLDGIAANANNYTHPAYTTRSIDANDVEVLDLFTSDATGHVTNITKRTLPTSTSSAVGVNRFATNAEGQTASSASISLTPASGLALLNYNQDMSYFADLTTANAATLPDGATAMIVTGTITI